jgi:alpha-glucosidase
MIGRDLLVAPVTRPDVTSRLVYLPKGLWYDYWTGKKYQGGGMVRMESPLETVPMFVRGGSIIPLGPEMKFVGEKKSDPLTFVVYPDENGSAGTTLYEDDGVSPDHKKGVFRRTTVSATRSGTGYVLNIGKSDGSYNPGPRQVIIQVVTEGGIKRAVTQDTGNAQRPEVR